MPLHSPVEEPESGASRALLVSGRLGRDGSWCWNQKQAAWEVGFQASAGQAAFGGNMQGDRSRRPTAVCCSHSSPPKPKPLLSTKEITELSSRNSALTLAASKHRAIWSFWRYSLPCPPQIVLSSHPLDSQRCTLPALLVWIKTSWCLIFPFLFF